MNRPVRTLTIGVLSAAIALGGGAFVASAADHPSFAGSGATAGPRRPWRLRRPSARRRAAAVALRHARSASLGLAAANAPNFPVRPQGPPGPMRLTSGQRPDCAPAAGGAQSVP